MSTATRAHAILRRSFRKAYPLAVRGEGAYLWDADGKRYLDFSGSAAVNFIGHGVPEISTAMAAQAAQLEFAHTSQFTTPIAEEYAEELLAFAGDAFQGGAVFFTSGGSEAVETALKLARQYQVEVGRKTDSRSSAASRVITARHWARSRFPAIASAARFICPWSGNSPT